MGVIVTLRVRGEPGMWEVIGGGFGVDSGRHIEQGGRRRGGRGDMCGQGRVGEVFVCSVDSFVVVVVVVSDDDCWW